MAIKGISGTDILRLTSGQVIVDISSAVKELLENSIDAGSTKIEVIFKDSGAQSIEVKDDGVGISPEDFCSICLRHHTSKLESFDDLSSVATLGFRGEALSSLCALASVKILTCTKKNYPKGSELKYNSMGELSLEKTVVGGFKGTSISITDLFLKLPVRRKNLLNNLKREYGRAISELLKYILINPHIKFIVLNVNTKTNKKNVVFLSKGTNRSSLLDSAVSVFGTNGSYGLISLDIQCRDREVKLKLNTNEFPISAKISLNFEGFISDCSFGQGRQSKDRQYFFINKRPVNLKKVLKTINDIYRSYNHAQYPVVILNLTADTQFLDINVTPDKRTVLIQNEDVIIDVLRDGLIELFDKQTHMVPKNAVERNGNDIVVTGAKNHQSNIATIPVNRENNSFSSDNQSRDEVTELMPANLRDEVTAAREMPSRSPSPSFSHDPPEPNMLDESMHRAQNQIDPHGHVNDCSDNAHNYDEKDLQEDEALQPSQMSLTGSKINDQKSSRITGNYNNRGTSTRKDLNSVIIKGNEKIYSGEEDKSSREASPPTQEENYAEKEITEQCPIPHDRKRSLSPTEGCHQSPEIGASAPSKVRKFSATEISHVMHNSITTRRQQHNNVYSCCEVLDLSSISNGDPKVFISSCDLSGKKLETGITLDDIQKLEEAEEILNLRILKNDFSRMEIVGQFNLGFIVVLLKGTKNLFIIDQHASDEKYNFERLTRNTKFDSQKLAVPMSLDVNAIDELIILDNLDVFKNNGFHVHFDPSAAPGARVKLLSLPLLKDSIFNVKDFYELVHLVASSTASNRSAVKCSKIRSILAMRSCRSSIMIGQHLTAATMQRIVLHLGLLEKPWNCPHGRPTMRHLSELNDWLPFSSDYAL